MKKKIFASICLVSLASLLLLSVCVVAIVYNQAERAGWSILQSDAQYISAGYESGGLDYLAKLRGYQGRITLIAPDGAVLYDDRQNPKEMESHAQRPEVAEAVEKGSGRSLRQSDTLGERTLYYALRLPDGSVLRVSMQTGSVAAGVRLIIPWLLAVSVVIILLAALVARWQTRRILRPINNIDLSAPLETGVYEELSPLLRRIASQKTLIDHKVAELRAQQEEFSSVTQSMDEGLILTDHEGRVLTINQSACGILGITADPQGRPLLLLNRDLSLQQAVRNAVNGQHTEQELTLNGRKYRLMASPTHNEEDRQGAVLLLMDDTEKLEAEQNRREFSANVSHELKTPLTSISGYAEIIRDGLVQPDDLSAFAGKIYDEAGHLIALIEDIIQLSRLDEKDARQPFEPIELLNLARNIAASLQGAAGEKEVTLEVSGEEISVPGAPSILLEVVYNLLDNAIRYNRPGGRVNLQVSREGQNARLCVSDTGIGIEPQHQSHIFERFYRVEKSHARQSGGTGLGLAIVKRGVLCHGGQVTLHSSPRNGSTFTVLLPAFVP